MRYAIVQKELVPPDLEHLTKAFCSLPELTGLDAQTAANDAYGILIRGLELDRANALQAALESEGVPTEVVSEAEFPAIPNGRIVRKVQFEADHLLTFDPMQRTHKVPYSDIMLIAAGLVHARDMRRPRPAEESAMVTHEASAGLRGGRDEVHDRMFIDVFLTDGTTRLSITADEFSFDHLGQRLSDDLAINYLFLIQELEERAPHASLNRGAFHACQKPPELFPYPSRPAYNEETIWMLWRIYKLLLATQAASS